MVQIQIASAADWEKLKHMTQLMTAADWKKVRHFSLAENWGDAYKMTARLVFTIDEIRDRVGYEFRMPAPPIRPGYAKAGHSGPKSRHCYGDAVDGWFQGVSFITAVARVEAAIKAMGIVQITGLGIYPGWSKPGIHFDFGAAGSGRRRWGWTGLYDSKGNMKYVEYDYALAWAREKGIG